MELTTDQSASQPRGIGHDSLFSIQLGDGSAPGPPQRAIEFYERAEQIQPALGGEAEEIAMRVELDVAQACDWIEAIEKMKSTIDLTQSAGPFFPRSSGLSGILPSDLLLLPPTL